MGIQHPADKVDVHRIIVHENNGQRQGGRSLHEWHCSVEAVRASHTRTGSGRCRRTPCTTAPRGARVAVLSEVSHHDTSDVSCPFALSLLQVQMVCQPRREENARGAAAGVVQYACSTCGTCLILRGRSLIVRENVQTESPEQPGKRKACGHSLKAQRCSFGRQPSLGPRRMRWAVGETVALATPAPCLSRKGQILCHYAGADRDDRATEATPASYPLRLILGYRHSHLSRTTWPKPNKSATRGNKPR